MAYPTFLSDPKLNECNDIHLNNDLGEQLPEV
jgi:hypothetical protein